jgi:predicted nucleic acid-binding protein
VTSFIGRLGVVFLYGIRSSFESHAAVIEPASDATVIDPPRLPLVFGPPMAGGSTLQAIRALSQYRPFEGGGDSVKDAHEDVVLAALAEAEGFCESIDACCETIRTLFRLDLSTLAIAGALAGLVREERVVSEGTGFRLTESEARRLEDVARESNETARAALADWEESLVQLWPLTSDELAQLRNDLVVFLRTVLRRHGAEASMLLYPDSEHAQALYADIEEQGLDFLDPLEDERLPEIRDWALSEFIRQPTDAQKAYLAQNLNTSYFLTVLSIDPEGARLVSEIASGQRVYLDTNFIYRLLGVQGPRYVRPAEAILKETHDAGYVTSVTPWTLDEFRYSLRRSRSFVDKYPIPPDQYAELAADATSNENFVTTYWRQVRTGVKPQDFFAYYEQVETHLKDREITIESSGCTAVDQQTDAITDAMSLLAKASYGRYRHPALLEHDVKHRMLIKRLRGDSNRNFSNAGSWFLTHDTVLPTPYSRGTTTWPRPTKVSFPSV